MKNSRTSLNKPFYDWIKEVREANKKIEELEDKLYYYNVKLIGYNSPNFEPRLSSTKPEYKDNRYFWIEKISILEKELKQLKKIIEKYKMFKQQLSIKENFILENYYNNLLTTQEKNQNSKYFYLNKISRKYIKNSKILL